MSNDPTDSDPRGLIASAFKESGGHGRTLHAESKPAPAPRPQQLSNRPPTKPKPVAGTYPPRNVVWYTILSSDLKFLGLTQFATTVLAAAGTFMLALYFDLRKEVQQTGTGAPGWMTEQRDQWFWGGLICLGLAVVTLCWRKLEYGRIKAEHGEKSLWGLASNYWRSFLTRLGA